MPLATTSTNSVRFARRQNWTLDEWIVAWDVCPKQKQSYGPSDRNVREVAYLLSRTPSAVSHGFGNLWYAWSRGRHGAKNASRLCWEVVALYRADPARLHKRAQEIRHQLMPDSLTPRLEIWEPEGAGIIQPNLSLAISEETGVPRRDFVLYNRRGSVIDGVALSLGLFGAGVTAGVGYTTGTRFVRFVENLVRRRRAASRAPRVVTRTNTWISLRNGDTNWTSELVIKHYLPRVSLRRLTVKQRDAFVSFFSPLLGLNPVPAEVESTQRVRAVPLSHVRVSRMERELGAQLTNLSSKELRELESILRAAKSKSFAKVTRGSKKRARPDQ